jgi:hypothetical protein
MEMLGAYVTCGTGALDADGHLICLEGRLGSRDAALAAFAIFYRGEYEPSDADGIILGLDIALTAYNVLKGRFRAAAGGGVLTPVGRRALVEAVKFRLAATLPRRRNVAAAITEVEGASPVVTKTASGTQDYPGAVGMPTDPVFRPTVAGTYVRDADAEYKLLEDIAARLGPASNVRGTVTIFTELSPCKSCAGVIEQFRQRYPNFIVEVIDGG